MSYGIDISTMSVTAACVQVCETNTRRIRISTLHALNVCSRKTDALDMTPR